MHAALLLLQLTIPAPTWSGRPVPLAAEALEETSALVPSPTRPGVFWTLNDSGNPAELFAVDTAGRDLGRVRIRGAVNLDWEALATGPCPARRGIKARSRCLYIGDIGDNARARSYIRIYRVAEPRPGEDREVPVLDSLRVVYPDSARDAESMVVDARGDLLIISKELVREPRIYRVAAAAWTRRGTARARYEATLPIPSASGVEQWTTDASWVRGGAALAVRTYGTLWLVPFARGRPVASGTHPLCRLAGLGPQGEGIAWIASDLYALTSEKLFRTPASITLVRCAE
jgi:hypothetical protein